MDFTRTIMTAARQNAENAQKKEIKYYSTKFEPPKKLERTKTLSANIQKFLAKKEIEEKQKAIEAKERRDKLLELRAQDKKATRRVSVMLKRTKSANQSAIQDAVDKDHTSVTLAGPSQPDEDDYGYVSQSAADFYNKMMIKYNSMPDERKYDFTKKKTNGSLSSTKDRVRSALDREQEEATQPHRRKRKHEETTTDYLPEEKKEDKDKGKPKLKPAPVINFSDLLKIAEKKQFEPIKVEPKPEKKEEERLFTKKQKREQEKEREVREMREKREKERAQGKIPKLPPSNGKPPTTTPLPKSGKPTANDDRKPITNGNSNTIKKREAPPTIPNGSKSKQVQSKCDINSKRSETKQAPSSHSNKLPPGREPSRDANLAKRVENGRNQIKKPTSSINTNPKTREPQQRDMKPKEFPPRDLKPKQFPPRDLKPKQFPPPDMRGRPPMGKRRPLPIHKGRFYDDDDEEYDSEMDDFIDDGPEEEEDYSKHIRELFGYDKRRYHHDDDADDNMESTFAQQMREECISTKIGIMEDLEELRKEEAHNRQKALIKKKLKK